MWVQISSGSGPEECSLGVGLFLKKVLKECKQKDLKIDMIGHIDGKYTDTYKSVLLRIEGQGVESYLKTIEGSILWICKSPYRPKHKRKNWFINVEAYKEQEKYSFDLKNVKIETMRSSGAGGQNVNKVETSVRITHLPTGITVRAQEERSQYRNKKLVLAMLEKILQSKNEIAKDDFKKGLWVQHQSLTRGNPVRTFVGEKFKIKE
ncbi:peptide chain release factor H [Marinisporobacter balticus]|uniref:Peptide chain release factor n=1 Tax=Marinisporobacter balticus TaxID=2018667 RepID=A0A4R2K7L7_9FIRM|nr:peptide chain release factor H [Marinisporobacter balticus]TCO69351.1 peptide chain release factor [Marinisporobacter balticus]